jgi:hypothetical protein
MSVLRDVSEPVDPPVTLTGRFRLLVDEKAWQHLGLTGEEFRRRWYAGEYDHDLREEVRALDQLMRSGQWDPDESSSPGSPQ